MKDEGLYHTPIGITAEDLATIIAILRGKVNDRSTAIEGEFL